MSKKILLTVEVVAAAMTLEKLNLVSINDLFQKDIENFINSLSKETKEKYEKEYKILLKEVNEEQKYPFVGMSF